ncbi:hypothetical protein EKO04_001696 [Ascochyta lentis]|uniref:Uncharacterized protein n=1 Tax=Ascochyta lentis TaxID=205686 RepID=A0A8H7JDI4_9PLEO|nr:hypothetical protein EKO04_001696 [Ascochyta lentis]
MTVQDRMNLTFRQTEIEVMSEKLRDCRLSVTSAVSTATLYSSIRNSQATADIQSAVFETQKTLQSAAGFSDNQATRLAVTLQQLQLDSGIDTRIDGTSYTELVTRLEEECKAAEATRTLLNRLYAKTHEEAIAKAIAESQNHSTHATSGDNNTGFQSEVVNDGV